MRRFLAVVASRLLCVRSEALQQLRAAGVETEEVIDATGLVDATGQSFHGAIKLLGAARCARTRREASPSNLGPGLPRERRALRTVTPGKTGDAMLPVVFGLGFWRRASPRVMGGRRLGRGRLDRLSLF
jgi:hypothetical protein